MTTHFEILRATRNNLLQAIESLSIQQLNRIPDGYSNNIGWNFCHVMVTQELLTYNLCQLPMQIPHEIVDLFRKGTTPEKEIPEPIIQYFKDRCLSSIDTLESDYNNDVLQGFKPYPTSYGITLESLDKAIIFNNVHEGLHYGYILAQKKLV